jgi:hypothetical protein
MYASLVKYACWLSFGSGGLSREFVEGDSKRRDRSNP